LIKTHITMTIAPHAISVTDHWHKVESAVGRTRDSRENHAEQLITDEAASDASLQSTRYRLTELMGVNFRSRPTSIILRLADRLPATMCRRS